MKTENLIQKSLVTAAFAAMVIVNFLANALPIGGVTTGEASDSYGNLFTPAGATFSIWGIIYILLLGHTLYQFGIWQKIADTGRERVLAVVRRYFLGSSLFNIAWIFAWHYGVIWLSVLIMLGLLYSLIRIADLIRKGDYSFRDKVFIRLPFSIYFGWITVATIANITVLLVSINWNGLGIGEPGWAMIVLLLGTGIGIARLLKDRDLFYGLVFLWAYGGIWLKHSSENGFNGRYPEVITTVLICLVLVISAITFMIFTNRKSKKT